MTDPTIAAQIEALAAWTPEPDDRVKPLLLAEAGRREARDWDREDAENVIAFLLSRLDASPAIVTAAPELMEAFNCPTADELEADSAAPWQGIQPIEDQARCWRGKLWVPLDVAIPALQFWQRRDYEHGRSIPPAIVTAQPRAEAAPGVVDPIVSWIDQAIERCKKHGNTEGIWLFASQWQTVRDILALARQHGAREGYVLVPKEPTEAMLEALHSSVRIKVVPYKLAADIQNEREVYAAMIAAAPATDVGEGK